ncbi:MAG: EAL domain-containing protein [Actinomycetota bacterium]|nr:EAL domain-containing protein [Actinomycetota bacterium]
MHGRANDCITGTFPSHPARTGAVWTFLAVAGIAIAATATGRFGAAAPAVLVAAATLASFAWAILHYRPSPVWPWVSVWAAIALFLAAGISRGTLYSIATLGAHRSFVPDALALPGYAFLAAGLTCFSRRRVRNHGVRVALVLEGLIAALALSALAWIYMIQPTFALTNGVLAAKILVALYPAISIFLVIVTLRIAFNPEQVRAPSYWFLLGGMTSLFAANTVSMLSEVHVVAFPQRLLGIPYVLACISTAATALHPSMRTLTERGWGTQAQTSRGRYIVISAALLVPCLLALPHPEGGAIEGAILFALVVTLATTVAVRLVQAVHSAAASEERFEFEATHDNLTGLPNRAVLERHLAGLLDEPAHDDAHVAVMFLDLDRFKLVNDTLGHGAGDQLLVEAAERLRANVRTTDLVTRIGGDEFMIVLDHLVSLAEAIEMADRLGSCIRAPFSLRGTEQYVSASIGLAFASGSDPGATVEILVRNADTAMYQAKGAGRDAVAVFDESMRAELSQRVELGSDLRRALEEDQFHLAYQPIVRLAGGGVEGVEGLVRWEHPVRGLVSPETFIPVAEETGLLCDIGKWVLDEALTQLASWRTNGDVLPDLYVAVNVSVAQLREDDFTDQVEHALTAAGLDGSALCLEVTEATLMDGAIETSAPFAKLHELGVRISIDDFGTDYTALANLRRFPVTTLKIDRTFVSGVTLPDHPEAALVAAMVSMAQALGIGTVAEAVETPVQAAALCELGCDAAQGFLWSRPVKGAGLPGVVASIDRQSSPTELAAALA